MSNPRRQGKIIIKDVPLYTQPISTVRRSKFGPVAEAIMKPNPKFKYFGNFLIISGILLFILALLNDCSCTINIKQDNGLPTHQQPVQGLHNPSL